jgi:hypothetical protein
MLQLPNEQHTLSIAVQILGFVHGTPLPLICNTHLMLPDREHCLTRTKTRETETNRVCASFNYCSFSGLLAYLSGSKVSYKSLKRRAIPPQPMA